jgi:hypothetical protein
MEKGLRFGMMAAATLVNIRKERNMEMVNTFGRIAAPMKVSG